MSADLAAFLLYLAGGGIGVAMWLGMWRKAALTVTLIHVIVVGAATIAFATALRDEQTRLQIAALIAFGLTTVAGLNLLLYHFGKLRPMRWEIWAHFGTAILGVGLLAVALVV